MPHLYGGTANRKVAFVPAVRCLGTERSVVSVYTTGMFYVRFAALKKEPPFQDEALRLELLARLNETPHFDLPPAVIDRYPGFPLPLLAEPGAMDAFIDAMEWGLGALTTRSSSLRRRLVDRGRRSHRLSVSPCATLAPATCRSPACSRPVPACSPARTGTPSLRPESCAQ